MKERKKENVYEPSGLDGRNTAQVLLHYLNFRGIKGVYTLFDPICFYPFYKLTTILTSK